jgi:hypothetical protein
MEPIDYETETVDSRNKHRLSKTHNKRMNVKETRERKYKMGKRQDSSAASRQAEKQNDLVQKRW